MADLEIIKRFISDYCLVMSDRPCAECEMKCRAYEAAERMADRIAELEEDLVIKEQERLGAMNATTYWYDNHQDSLTEITRLQDKIEKYNCADCKNLKGPNDANCVECLNGVFDYMSINNLSICALKCGLWEASSGGK